MEVNHTQTRRTKSNAWKLSNSLLKNEWVTKEIKEEIKKYLQTNENEDTSYQNLWDAAKAVLRRKFIALQAFLRKEERAYINSLTSQLKILEKDQKKEPKPDRRKEIIKIRAEINDMETKKKNNPKGQ